MSITRQVSQLRPGDRVELIHGEDAATFLLSGVEEAPWPVATPVCVTVALLSLDDDDDEDLPLDSPPGTVRVGFLLTEADKADTLTGFFVVRIVLYLLASDTVQVAKD